MLINHSSAGPGTAENADAYTASPVSALGSVVHDSFQGAQKSDEMKGGYDGGSTTPSILVDTKAQVPPAREARHFFRPRPADFPSSQNDSSSCLNLKDHPRAAPLDNTDADAQADSRQSLNLISDACSTEIDASAALAAGATGRLRAAPSQLSLQAQLQRVSVSSSCSLGQSDEGRSPAGVPATICEQLPTTALIQQNTRNIHDVARLVSQLFGSKPGHEFSFGTGAGASPSAAAPQKRLKLQSCWPASWRKKMTGMPVCHPQLSKAEAAKIMHAAVLSQGGATISDVVLDLGKAGCLVLQGTSCTELRNVHIEGGILLCHGAQCHLSITDCSFKGCKLLIAEGATVSIHRTHIQEHLSINNAAFVVSGRGTTVHATDTHVSVGRGFIVQDRATLTGSSVHVTGTNGALITASGAGTELTLERSHTEFLRDRSNPAVAAGAGKLFRGVGVVASDGAALTLRDCELREFFRGVHAVRHGRVRLEGCVVKTGRSDGEGVYAQMGNVSMQDTRVLGCGEYGMCVGGGGPTTTAHLFAEGCTVEGSTQTVTVQKNEWSSAEIRQCELNGTLVTTAW